MTRNTRLATLILLGIVPLAGFAAEPGSQAGSPPGAAKPSDTGTTQAPADFKRLDKDKDGMLSKDEAKADKKLTAQYDKLDADHDGKLTLTEWQAGKSPAGAAGVSGESRMKGTPEQTPSGAQPATPATPPSQQKY